MRGACVAARGVNWRVFWPVIWPVIWRRGLGLAVVLVALWGALLRPAQAFEIEAEARFGPTGGAAALRILSTADIDYFTPVVLDFLADSPGVSVDYVVASSTQVMAAIHDEGAAFDLVVSSAMDLQTKLANDGFARRHRSGVTEALPDWAEWNDMVFAITQEPAAIVVSRAAFEGLAVPTSRQALIRTLRAHPERFRARVGTYDVRVSGLGYLFATQDTRASDTFWRLTEVMGALDPQLFCCSSDMLNAVARGDLAVAYNVLGSYAQARDAREVDIILPEDFTTVMLRSALIPESAPAPEMAARFLDHMLARAHGPGGAAVDVPGAGALVVNRIRLGPGLLVFLDRLKRAAFLREWEAAILQR